MSQLSSPGLPSLAEIAANPHRIAMLSGPIAAAFSAAFSGLATSCALRAMTAPSTPPMRRTSAHRPRVAPGGGGRVMAAPAVTLDEALEGRFAATSLALAVLGLNAELEGFELSPKEIARRVDALGLLAADVLNFTEQLEAVLERQAEAA